MDVSIRPFAGHRTLIATAAIALFTTAAPAFADPGTPLTPPLQLDGTSELSVLQSLARNATGAAVALYSGTPQAGGADAYAQLINADGTLNGARLNLPKATIGPVAAMDADGDFVVVWGNSADLSHEPLEIHAQRYDHDGAAVGTPVTVYQAPLKNPTASLAVAMDDDGDFAVKWMNAKVVKINFGGYSYFSSSSASTYLRLYSADASPRSDVIQVAQDPKTYNQLVQLDPLASSLAMDPAGNVTIAWIPHYGPENWRRTKLQFRRFDIDGQPLGNAVTVSSVPPATQRALSRPVVAAGTSGNFNIAWVDDDFSDAHIATVRMQRYSADGSSLGAPIQIANPAYRHTRGASLSIDAADRSVLVWPTRISINDDPDQLVGQFIDGNGNLLGSQFTLAEGSIGVDHQPLARLNTNGDLLAAWNPFSDNHIYAQSFSGPN